MFAHRRNSFRSSFSFVYFSANFVVHLVLVRIFCILFIGWRFFFCLLQTMVFAVGLFALWGSREKQFPGRTKNRKWRWKRWWKRKKVKGKACEWELIIEMSCVFQFFFWFFFFLVFLGIRSPIVILPYPFPIPYYRLPPFFLCFLFFFVVFVSFAQWCASSSLPCWSVCRHFLSAISLSLAKKKVQMQKRKVRNEIQTISFQYILSPPVYPAILSPLPIFLLFFVHILVASLMSGRGHCCRPPAARALSRRRCRCASCAAARSRPWCPAASCGCCRDGPSAVVRRFRCHAGFHWKTNDKKYRRDECAFNVLRKKKKNVSDCGNSADT